ncbi:MAG: glycosyltransferase [Tannerella sp.]|jgi:glycosyltransferase involved in cell wall biosynthesis|nr:glycosyltransferase [Tannerella sp.]
MKVLILCDMFPPAFGPRMGYLCKYLKQSGWEPTVITEHIPDTTFTFLKGDFPVIYIDYYKNKSKLAWIKIFLLNLFFNYKDRKIYKEALRQIQKQQFDLILCSTYRTYPLLAAQKTAQKAKLPLIVDLRDIIEQYTGAEFISYPLPRLFGLEKQIVSIFRKKNLKQRNRVLRQANYVTTVSPWHVETLKPYNANISLIYNGYDPDIFYPEAIESDRFYITYTGRLLSIAMRNPELLFLSVRRLSDEHFFTSDTFRMRWYVDEASREILQHEAEKCGIAEYMSYFGYIPASDVPTVLNESSILLLLTNKADASGPKGIMTTKFFEALAVEKPILCVRGDEGCLEEVIRRTQAGLSAHTEEEVYQFIKKYYLQWKAVKHVTSNPDRGEVMKFSRKEQAADFIRIFEQTIRANE